MKQKITKPTKMLCCFKSFVNLIELSMLCQYLYFSMSVGGNSSNFIEAEITYVPWVCT